MTTTLPPKHTPPLLIASSFRVKFKTERCKYIYELGACPFQDSCAFAHAQHELRLKSHLNGHYKTKHCQNFKNGYCKYGERCLFLHEADPPSKLESDSKTACSSSTENQQSSRTLLKRLEQFGIEFIQNSIKRSEKWQQFICNNIDSYGELSQQSQRPHNFSKQLEEDFPDCNFKRKARLFSM